MVADATRMINLPPLDPLATAGAPLTSTIVVVGAPFVIVAALMIAVFGVVVGIAVVRARPRRRRLGADTPRRALPVGLGYTAAAGQR